MNNTFAAKIARAMHGLKKRLRMALDGLGFSEVTTAVRTDDGLRPCMELELRATLASGLEGVYEIGPCFRDEQPDDTHLPEFQMLELFWNRPSFATLVHLTRDLFEAAFQCTLEGFEALDLATCLPARYPGLEYGMTAGELFCLAKRYLDDQQLSTCDRSYKVYNALIDKLIEERKPGTLKRPAIVVNYPVETVCLAKPQDGCPERIQRAEFFVNGLELAHGFVDDMDVERVRRRMYENGDEFVDEDFLALLASGKLPPSSGVGFGLDRLLMVQQGLADVRECTWKGMCAA